MSAVIDNSRHQTTYYTTDGYQIYNTDTTPETLLFESKYDEDGNFTETTNGVTYSYVSSDSSYDEQTGMTTATFTIKDRTGATGSYVYGANVDYTAQGVTDYFGRVKQKTYTSKTGDTVNFSNTVNYGYYSPQADRTSDTILSMNNAITGENNYSETLNYGYIYDDNGNITEVRQNDVLKCKYYYDEANQIVREDNVDAEKTMTYAYDNGGNIVSKTEYAYTSGALGTVVKTTPYTYGDTNWQDKLTSYDGNAVTYDAIGNATSIGNKTYTWTNGRQLAQFEDEDFRIEYTYNADGLRTMKKIYGKDTDSQTGEVTEHLWRHFDYVWKDGVLDSAKVITYDEQTHEVASETAAKYLYDAEKTPVGLIFTDPNDSTKSLKAWYVKNLQGDVTAVYVEGEGVAVRYTYDAWGKIEVIGGDIPGLEGAIFAMIMTVINPITYRGYSFDMESYTYYLQSRYYDPQIGRFLNADYQYYLYANTGITGTNVFAYCENNPIKYTDPTGTFKSEYHKDVTLKMATDRLLPKFAKALSKACGDTDDVYKPTRYWDPYVQSFHFNVNIGKPNLQDSRDIRDAEMCAKAIKYIKAAKAVYDYFNKKVHDNTGIIPIPKPSDIDANLKLAFMYYGYGLHTQQDKIIHNGPNGNMKFLSGYRHSFDLNFDSETKPWYADPRFKCSEVAEAVTTIYIASIIHDLKQYDLDKYCTKG